MATNFGTLARAKYIELTTFRKTGEGVSTAVWLAADGDAVIVLTGESAGKVKRIRHTTAVTMRPCNVVGRAKRGVDAVDGVAEIVTDPAREWAYIELLRKKYGWQFRLAFGSESKQKERGHPVVLRITPA